MAGATAGSTVVHERPDPEAVFFCRRNRASQDYAAQGRVFCNRIVYGADGMGLVPSPARTEHGGVQKYRSGLVAL